MTSPFSSLFSLVLHRGEPPINRLLSSEEINTLRRIIYQNSIVTSEEALVLFRFQHSSIPKICEKFDLPVTTQLLAHLLLSKYSLKHSVLTHDMKHVMVTCCYFATKLDNVRLAFTDLCAGIKNLNPHSIEAIEFVLLEMLDFHPWVFTAYPCALSIALEMNLLRQIDHESLEKNLALVYQTDMPLMFNEAHISIYVLCKLFSKELLSPLIEKFDFVFEDLNQYSTPEAIKMEQLKDVDRRVLQYRKNASKNE